MSREFGIIDLFAGPGGLGEGFSAAGREGSIRMKIELSIEMDNDAIRTLRLRSFLRSFEDGFPQEYYDALNAGKSLPDWSDLYPEHWDHAVQEARRLELGKPGVFGEVARVLDRTRERYQGDTILIGGPPCQAYSLVGRARNQGKSGYIAEEDHRHYLYREYVRILDRLRPAAFVMENVKGMLSSKVGGGEIFQHVLNDLREAGDGYKLLPLAEPLREEGPRARDFIVRAEQHGVPQERHRVFIVGIRSDLSHPDHSEPLLQKTTSETPVSVQQSIADLPKIRSRLSKGDKGENHASWRTAVLGQAQQISSDLSVDADLRNKTKELISKGLGSLKEASSKACNPGSNQMSNELRQWCLDGKLSAVLHHESRGHKPEDLGRYLYSSVMGAVRGESPRLRHFPDFLQPNHKNRESGKFQDRFKVQRANRAASTITSHIKKDGHYYIHPDPMQVRSLTAREAARLQTFPDNYYFCGSTLKFANGTRLHQVGNAVPPFLAYQIAKVLKGILALR